MQAKKLVRRVADADDKRLARVEATEEGRRLYADLFPQLAAINRRIMEALDAAEAALLEQFLERLTARAEQIHDEGDGVDVRADRRLGGSRRFWN